MKKLFGRVFAVVICAALLLSVSGGPLCVRAVDVGVGDSDDFDGVIDADDLFGGGSTGTETPKEKETADGLWECVTTEKGAELTAYLGAAAEIAIPQTVTVGGSSYTVWKLGDSIFDNNDVITGITLSDGVLELGKQAFYGCDNLTAVTLCDGLTTIGQDAFGQSPKVTIWCNEGTLGHTYAEENGIAYQLLNPSIPALAFAGASLSLQHNLAVNYKVDKALFADGAYSDPYVVFTLNGKETTVSQYLEVGDRYIFTFRNIAPNQMNDTICATLYATLDGETCSSETREYSVAQYCYNMLKKCTGDEYAKLRTLLVDLLNYGAQSQLYTAYNTTALVNKDLTEAQKAWGTNADPVLNSVKNTAYETVENPKAAWKGGGLKLENAVTLRFKLAADSIEGLSVRIRTDSQTWQISSTAFVATDGGYYVYFNGLHAGQMRESVYLTVYEGDTPVSDTACYSVESYAYEKQDSTASNLAALVKAMMCYGDSAYAYENQ